MLEIRFVQSLNDFESLLIYCIYEHKVKTDIIYWLKLMKSNGKYFDKYHHRGKNEIKQNPIFFLFRSNKGVFSSQNCWCFTKFCADEREMIICSNCYNPVRCELQKFCEHSHIFRALHQNVKSYSNVMPINSHSFSIIYSNTQILCD